jgi:hypothetical protein
MDAACRSLADYSLGSFHKVFSSAGGSTEVIFTFDTGTGGLVHQRDQVTRKLIKHTAIEIRFNKSAS